VNTALPLSFGLRFGFLLLALVSFSGCSDKNGVKNDSVKAVTDFFQIKLGDKTVRLQIAVSALEQQQGLMFRKDIGENDGMVFVYGRPQAMGYWMRNTPTPLDIGYFDENGVLQEIYPMYAFDETPVRSISKNLKFAVEMNQGWYQANKVGVGAKLDLDAIRAAMKERGFDPLRWNLR
jgi:uncharacterized membrane protein (UPF0127 family)